MILAIGNDLVDIRRIEKALKASGKRFEQRIFTAAEIKKADSRSKAGVRAKTATLAKRFAAKEACAKALGTGHAKGIYLKQIEIENLPSGKPTIALSGKAADALRGMVPKGMKGQINLSMTDEYPFAQALVIISAVAL